MKVKLIVDRPRTRVLFAEAGSDFLDVLLAFLTLPLSTVHLAAAAAGASSSPAPPGSTSCLSNLCASVDRLREAKFLKVDACHGTLLSPTHTDEFRCSASLCSRCTPFVGKQPSLRPHGALCRCWEPMARLVHVYSQATRAGTDSGLFCKGKERFVISDDWATIKPASTSTVVSLLLRGLGSATITDGGYEELEVDIGWAEVVSLLKTCNSSTTIFTDAFLVAKDPGAVRRRPALTKRSSTLPLRTTHKRRRHEETDDGDGRPGSDSMNAQIGIKLFFDRHEKKVMYAECKHQFVDLLLSFLAYPLGCVLKNLAGTSHLYGSFNNLYSNAAGLLPSSSLSSSMLLDPSIAPFKNPGSNGGSEKAVVAWHHLCRTPAGGCSCPMGERSCRWCDPGFVDDYTYVVDDELSIHQASAAWVLRHWCNRDAGQVAEVDIVAISKQEAVALLPAVVNSKTALTDVFKGRLLDQLQRKRRMQIFVKILAGETITIDVESSDTIAAVRRKIHAKKKLIESWGLVYGGKLLQDQWTLADCGIHREATIHAEFYRVSV